MDEPRRPGLDQQVGDGEEEERIFELDASLGLTELDRLKAEDDPQRDEKNRNPSASTDASGEYASKKAGAREKKAMRYDEMYFIEKYVDGHARHVQVRYVLGNKILRGPGYEWVTPLCLILFCGFVHWLASRVSYCDEVSHLKKWVDIACVWTALILFWTAFTNPGHIIRKMTYNEFLQFSEHREITCYSCLTLKSDDATHCSDCGICVMGLDHHCVVMGNCIGKYNIVPFYLMLVSSIVSIMSVYVIAIYSLQKCYSKEE